MRKLLWRGPERLDDYFLSIPLPLVQVAWFRPRILVVLPGLIRTGETPDWVGRRSRGTSHHWGLASWSAVLSAPEPAVVLILVIVFHS